MKLKEKLLITYGDQNELMVRKRSSSAKMKIKNSSALTSLTIV